MKSGNTLPKVLRVTLGVTPLHSIIRPTLRSSVGLYRVSSFSPSYGGDECDR